MPASVGRALFVVENLPVPLDRRVWNEATTLRDHGWEVEVIGPATKRHPSHYEELQGVRVHRHPLPPEGDSLVGFAREYLAALWHELRLSRRIYKQRPFDVIHICNPPDLLFLVAAWFRLRHGVRVVFDQHDLGPELFTAKFGKARGLLYQLQLLVEKLSYATAHHVIATNQTYRAVAMTRGGKAAEDVTIVRSGPDPAMFAPVERDDRYRCGRRHLLGYLGVMGDQEGIDILLEALQILVHERGRDVQLMLIGGGPAVERLRELGRRLGLAGHVEFTGRVSDEELIARLSSADVCVNPDPKNGFNELCTMNKIIEYMALARPVVQFDLLEGRHSAGSAALYAEPNDPGSLASEIEALLDEPERAAVLGRLGRERVVKELGWPQQREPLMRAYGAVMS